MLEHFRLLLLLPQVVLHVRRWALLRKPNHRLPRHHLPHMGVLHHLVRVLRHPLGHPRLLLLLLVRLWGLRGLLLLHHSCGAYSHSHSHLLH